MYVLIHKMQLLGAYWKNTVFKSSCSLKNYFLVGCISNGTPLHSAGKYFPETPLETPQVMWCIYREKYFNFSRMLVVLHATKKYIICGLSLVTTSQH